MSTIITTIITSSVVTAIVNIVWKWFDNRMKFKNAKYMQISNYYREFSGEKMHSILNSWTEMLVMGEDESVKKRITDKSYISNLLKDTFLYSSPETCKRLSSYQTNNYSRDKGDNYQLLVLVAGIIVSLKHDFTGEWVPVEEILKLKLNDYQANKEEFEEAIQNLGYQ